MASFQRPTARTALPGLYLAGLYLAGLYLAGGGCHPGAGVPMAAWQAARSAGAIIRRRASCGGHTGACRPTICP